MKSHAGELASGKREVMGEGMKDAGIYRMVIGLELQGENYSGK